MTKKELRQQIKRIKQSIPQTVMQVEADMVFSAIEKMAVWESAGNILFYWSLPDELPTHAAVQRWVEMGKSIYLPRVAGDDLEVVSYRGPQDLDTDNRYHIGEPVGEAVSASLLDLIIVPAVALDKNRNRLGRGKGFYDRLLSTVNCPTIGVAMDFQLVEQVPCEAHDRQLDCVVTGSEVLIHNS